ncbi:D-2-hydroxyglutarate dehydrogenase, mitochondrial-like isoform X1 [Macrosteles quadrilineatus]|uniref:D-2-hydroxyglutarate dehydrogenase, mitochondrial-like isoform X1 n=2 Tax=Macrosteles quadrilineatus TaxID=74068 RepID=UPI0023E0D7E3|nr:D-2-hydroxyglutarate dehydrogenase, mitochondrial-like isoform X1 [Macrosteles quadrilineatus]
MMALSRNTYISCVRAFSSASILQYSAEVPFTADQYSIKRGAFAELRDVHLQHFQKLLQPGQVLTDPSELRSHNTDWFKHFRGNGKVILKPKNTEEVSAILKFCYTENLAVVPQGGNTGVLGGSVPIFDEVIISTSYMNKIIQINEIPGSIVCQAGCVLETLDNALADHGLMMPLDLGAKGSCHIGGNIATNAGGLRLLRYGSLQANTLGLVAVKSDGQVIDCMNTLKKDNTGYHLKHLFVGSEGTLGLVTEVAIQCPPKPQSVSLALLGMKTFDHALQCFRLARSLLAEVISSCEVMDYESLSQVTKKLRVSSPLDDHPFYILLEVSGSCRSHDEEKLNSFLQKALDSGTINDGLVTNEPSKMNKLWQLRERIPEALFTDSYAYLYDISLPLDSYYQIVPELRTRLQGTEATDVTGFGHLGDGNLHLNICAPQFSPELLAKIEPFVFEWISERGGSISAEHGIGFKKTEFLRYSKSDAAIHTMRQMKQLMDPKGILNPYKVLPVELF